MKQTIRLIIGGVALCAAAWGCAMCSNPYDNASPVYGLGGGCENCGTEVREGSNLAGEPAMTEEMAEAPTRAERR